MAVMLQSANEMSVAVAEEVSGSVKKFTELMNWRAKLFGCKNTHFNNPNGLPDETHYTTASDMAKDRQIRLAESAFPPILHQNGIMKSRPTNKFAEARQLLNHHKMMKNGEYYYEGVLGGKTGYTDASGNTLVTYCKRGNMTLVAVILNSTSAANAYSDTASLFNYGFENFEKMDMKVSMEPVPFKVLPCDKYILKNNGNTYPFYYQTNVYVTVPKGIKKITAYQTPGRSPECCRPAASEKQILLPETDGWMGNAIRTKCRIRPSPPDLFLKVSYGGEIRAFHGFHPPLLYLLLSGFLPRNIFPHRFFEF